MDKARNTRKGATKAKIQKPHVEVAFDKKASDGYRQKYTPYLFDQVAERIAVEGLDLYAACEGVICWRTLQAARKDHPQDYEIVLNALEWRDERILGESLKIADDCEEDFRSRKVRVDARNALLDRSILRARKNVHASVDQNGNPVNFFGVSVVEAGE
jgi:hypothetical protein